MQRTEVDILYTVVTNFHGCKGFLRKINEVLHSFDA